jgi:hypothetical protein
MIKTKRIHEYLAALKEYFVNPLKGIFKGEDKIKNPNDLRKFIQEKSALVSQQTLYGYVKTRIGTRFVMMFNDDQFAKSIDIAKWNIYVVSLQDLSFFCLSYLYAHNLYKDTDLAKSIYLKILSEEKKNGLEEAVYQKAISQFEERFSQINWTSHYQSDCFLTSSQALYYWAPIADELKKLDKAIVINSMHLKWENLKKDFSKLLVFTKI